MIKKNFIKMGFAASVLCFALSGCGSKESKNTEDITQTGNTNTSETKANDSENTSEISSSFEFSGDFSQPEEYGYTPFWLKYADFDSMETKDLSNLEIAECFTDSTSLEELLRDDSYSYYELRNDSGSVVLQTDDVEELLQFNGPFNPYSDEMGVSYKCTIYMYSDQESAENHGHALEINIYTLTLNENVSFSDCLTARNFQVGNNNDVTEDALLYLGLREEYEYKPDYSMEDLEAVMELLGKPSHVYFGSRLSFGVDDRDVENETFEETLEKGGGILSYDMVWDLENGKIVLGISERGYQDSATTINGIYFLYITNNLYEYYRGTNAFPVYEDQLYYE